MSQRTAATRKAMRASTAMLQFLGWLGRSWAHWQHQRQLRRDRTWLENQPDYLLRDIGISRIEIDAIIRKGRYR